MRTGFVRARTTTKRGAVWSWRSSGGRFSTRHWACDNADVSARARTPADRSDPATPRPVPVSSVDELVDIIGTPIQRVAEKVRPALTDVDREWLAHSPFCLLATTDADGRCDVSPKGDPAGIAHVLDDHHLVLPDRPGNRRVDGFRNILENPRVGLLFLIPGRGDTLRVNGAATLIREAPWFDDLVVRGHRPVLAVLVEVEEVFSHCSKAFLRSELWRPETWQPDAVSSRAVIAKSVERPETSLADLQTYYGPSYEERLYT